MQPRTLCLNYEGQKLHKNVVWATYPSVSSASVFHNRDIGNGVASVTENSLTLKAGERIAH